MWLHQSTYQNEGDTSLNFKPHNKFMINKLSRDKTPSSSYSALHYRRRPGIWTLNAAQLAACAA